MYYSSYLILLAINFYCASKSPVCLVLLPVHVIPQEQWPQNGLKLCDYILEAVSSFKNPLTKMALRTTSIILEDSVVRWILGGLNQLITYKALKCYPRLLTRIMQMYMYRNQKDCKVLLYNVVVYMYESGRQKQ